MEAKFDKQFLQYLLDTMPRSYDLSFGGKGIAIVNLFRLLGIKETKEVTSAFLKINEILHPIGRMLDKIKMEIEDEIRSSP